jgi:hypothetical protein
MESCAKSYGAILQIKSSDYKIALAAELALGVTDQFDISLPHSGDQDGRSVRMAGEKSRTDVITGYLRSP